jgi:hypothetical protein
MQVHIPARARPAGGGDANLAVIDQSTHREYDFWQVQSRTLPSGGGPLTISYGGWTTVDVDANDGLASDATAAHFGLAAGVIRGPEIQAGRIDHALYATVYCDDGTKVGAARGLGRSCSQVGLPNSGAPAMGQHLFLDMSDAQIDALGKPAWEAGILKAMAHYGMIIGDTGGGKWGWSIQPESGSSYTSFGRRDPWVAVAQKAGRPAYRRPDGKTEYSFVMHDIEWAKYLKVLDPCVDAGTCS